MLEPTDVHAWLLEDEQPSLRYRTLTELLEVPARDQRARRARQAIASSPQAELLWSRMHPGGYWLQPTSASSPSRTATPGPSREAWRPDA